MIGVTLTAALAVGMSAIFFGARLPRDHLGWTLEGARKTVHVMCALGGAGLIFMVPDRPVLAAAALLAAAAIWLGERLGLRSGVTDRDRSLAGPVLGFAAYGVLVAFAPRLEAVAAAFVVLAVGDTAACWAGRRWGRRRIDPRRPKTWIGAGAFALTAFPPLLAILVLFQGATLQVLLLATVTTLAAAALEACLSGAIDNFVVPVAVTILLTLGQGWAGDPVVAGAQLLAVAGVLALAAWRRWLRPEGLLAAGVVGLVVFMAGGWRAIVVLLVFFIASSILTRLRPAMTVQSDAKLGRDAAQVGAWTVAPVAALALAPAEVAATAFCGAVAAACADTFATEIGRLSPAAPRLITTGARVPRGTSGGVTGLGLMGSALGAAAVAATALGCGLISARQAGWVVGAGLLASLLDSWLGAALQRRYLCPCHGESEEATCPSARRYRGVSWLSNAGVNAVVSAAACAAAAAGALL